MDAIIIAFASGKGGTGKSTTTVFVGGALAALGKKVLLIELDSGLRSVDIIAGISGKTVYDIEDVLSGRCEADKAIIESPTYRGLSIISAPYSGGNITTKALKFLCAKLRSDFDYILLDTAAGIGPAFQSAAQTAHRMILVLTPDPVALRDGRMIADQLNDSPLSLRLVLNRVNTQQILRDRAIRDLDEAIDIVGVQLLGVVPESSSILKAGISGGSFPSKSIERTVYKNIARRILGEDVPLAIQ